MTEKLHVVIPAFREQDSIASVLEDLATKVSAPVYVTVVCDSWDDPTFDAVDAIKALHATPPIVKAVNQFGSGALNAIKTGLLSTEPGDCALVVMADGCDDLDDVDKMFDLQQRGYDVVCGSRYMKGGRQVGGPRFKKLLSRTAGVSLHVLTGIPVHDITNSFKLYSPRVLRDIPIDSVGGFELGMELTIKAFKSGMKIAEIPTVWTEYRSPKTRFKLLKWVPHYWKWYWHGLVSGYGTQRNSRG